MVDISTAPVPPYDYRFDRDEVFWIDAANVVGSGRLAGGGIDPAQPWGRSWIEFVLRWKPVCSPNPLSWSWKALLAVVSMLGRRTASPSSMRLAAVTTCSFPSQRMPPAR